jgi:hypothetical protein
VTGTTASSALAVPGAITGLAVGTVTNTSLPLSWTNPASGGAIAYITVQYRTPSGTGTWTTANSTVPATQTSYIIGGLTAGTAYDVQVFATNASGAGTADLLNNVSTGASTATFTITVLGSTTMPYQSTYSLTNANGTNDTDMSCAVTVSPTPAAVWYFTTQSSSGAPAVGTTLNTSGGTQGGLANSIYYGTVPRPTAKGTWYVYAVAVGAGNVVGGILTGPAFTVVA